MTPQQAIERAQHLLAAGDAPAAEAILQRVSRQHPNAPHAWHLLGLALLQQRKLEPAAYHLRRALAREPGSAAIASALAAALGALERHEESLRVWDQILAHSPDHVHALNGRGIAQASLSRFETAAKDFERVLSLDPRFLAARRNRATLYMDMGLVREAAAELRAALQLEPDNPLLLADLAGALNYLDDAEPREVFEVHLRVGEVVERHAPRLAPPDDKTRDRALRIGYMSSDLRAHSVASFLEPLLRHHDRERFEPTCYFTGRQPDAVTRHLCSLVPRWRDAAETDDATLARRIRDDGIDILIELNGLTHGQRLGVLACRPAPVQATYCGYPNTTGFRSIDHRIVDPWTDPAGAEELAVERLVRLEPCFLCFQPPGNAPEPSAPPSIAAGHITFGSFNMLPKVSDATLRLWGDALRAVPASRLLLKAKSLDHAVVRAQLLRRAAAAGIDSGRIELVGHTAALREHLAMYSRIDIALDTFPYNGTTTTCEALWMGVPVVSRAGDVHRSRVGLSLLNAAGLRALAAESDQQFVDRARDLAADPTELARTRARLRERMSASPLCNGPAFALRFEAALADMWQRWCDQV